jgi:hypothetical protein
MTRRALLASVAGLFLRPDPEQKNLHVRIATELLARIEREARAENITPDEFLRRAVEDYVSRHRRSTAGRGGSLNPLKIERGGTAEQRIDINLW